MSAIIDNELLEQRAKLLGSFLLFVQTFFPLVVGREFYVSEPVGRESHFVTIARELTEVFRQQKFDTVINVPPGHGKSTLLAMWVAWCMAHNPQSNFLYISYGHELAAKHTDFIKRIISNSYYMAVFDIDVSSDSRAKDSFRTWQGGTVKAFGSSGAITGQDAGLPNCAMFSGAVVIDDAHKPDEVHSDTRREGVIQNYRETILQRPRAPTVPIIYIGQRLHEDDLCNYLLSGEDERKYDSVILKAVDLAGNALYPELNPLSQLLEKKDKNPYVFASQYQQDPIPSGGALFKPEHFIALDFEPELISTFITADTAETDKSYNDATVFGFWGYYQIYENGIALNAYALHLLDLWEIRVEPKDLEESFKSFYGDCLLHKMPPEFAAIEKKSTGVTLLSTLQSMRGLALREVKRTKASGSKTVRFLEMQPIIASKLVSFTKGAKHGQTFVDHMIKITANNTHRHDDVCHVAGSKIATLFGYKNIEDITTSDKVITPFGVGSVIACGSTGKFQTIKRVNLHGTPNHPVFYKDGFKPLDSIYDAVNLDLLSFKGLIKWRYLSLLTLMETGTTLLARSDITFIATKTLQGNTVASDCMWQFGNLIQERKLTRAMWFIIKMVTLITTTSITLSVFHISNICRSIAKLRLHTAIQIKTKLTWQKFGKKLQNGIEAKKVESGTANRLWKHIMHALKTSTLHALYAIKNLSLPKWELCQQHADLSVTLSSTDEISVISQQNVSCATMNSPQRSIIPSQETEKLALNHAQAGLEEVYNLTVDVYGVYYVNDILASNCDVTYDAIKLALIDKSLQSQRLGEARTAKLRKMANAEGLRASALSHKADRR